MPPLEKEHSSELPVFNWQEIKKHDQEKDAWVVKDGKVYDVSKFLQEHPGGLSRRRVQLYFAALLPYSSTELTTARNADLVTCSLGLGTRWR